MEDKSWNEKYDKKDYNKQIYSFSTNEVARLTPWDVQIQLGSIAQNVLSGILRGECLKRVGVKPSVDVGVEYNIQTGKFVVYVPKLWCSACTNRKASFSYSNKVYCSDCAKTLKKQVKAQADKAAEEKPDKKKKK